MAALLVAMSIMAVMMTVAMPVWKHQTQREREEELVFRGMQYVHAIALFQRKFANAYPPNVDVLVDQRFLRKKFKDPMTEDGEFQVIYANQVASAQPSAGVASAQPSAGGTVPTQGQPQQRPATAVGGSGLTAGAQGGIIGVASKSTDQSIRIFNAHDHYNEWVFVAQQASGRIGAPNGSQTPTGGVNLPSGAPGGIGGRGGRGPDGRGGIFGAPGGQPNGPGRGGAGRGFGGGARGR